MIAKVIAAGLVPTLLAPAGQRGQHQIYNGSSVVIYLALDGDDEVTTATGMPLNPGDRFFHEPPNQFGQVPPAIYAIHGSGADQTIRYGCATNAA